MKRILLLSPINKWGGANIEAGFIAEFYANDQHEIFVLSSAQYFEDCSIFKFIDRKHFDSIDRLVVSKHRWLRSFLRVLAFIKPLASPDHHRLDNKWVKLIFPISSYRLGILIDNIKGYDVVLMVNQLTGSYVKDITSIASKYNKKLILRVSGQVNQHKMFTPENISWLKKIDCFIYHSKTNQNIVKRYLPDNHHRIIDQCVVDEDRYRSKKKLDKCQHFYTMARLDKLKRIDLIIKAIRDIPHQDIRLDIYGDGKQRDYLKSLAKDDNRINIHDFVPIDDVYKIHEGHDCLIISSLKEAGPYTGLEAMAAGNLIITNRVGAMEDRLGKDYPLFYDDEDIGSKINEAINMTGDQIKKIADNNRSKYFQEYTFRKIQKKYVDLLGFI